MGPNGKAQPFERNGPVGKNLVNVMKFNQRSGHGISN